MITTFVIGDIHGCLEDLNNLLAIVDLSQANTKLIFMGDYIDRGPNIVEVVQRVMDLETQYGRDKVICLMGNHDYEFFILGYTGLAKEGTLKQYSVLDQQILRNHKEWATTLRTWYEDDKNYYVHGGLLGGKHPREEHVDNLIWLRNTHNLFHDKCLVTGHTPHMSPDTLLYEVNDVIVGMNVDGARVFGGNLLMAILHDGRYSHTQRSNTGRIK